MLGAKYFKEVFRAISPHEYDGQHVSHVLQSNLAVRLDSFADVFERKFFRGVGTSFDLYGDLRRGINGKPNSDLVLENIFWLRERGVRPGIISVLHRPALEKIDDMLEFFGLLGLSLRLLPVYRSGYPAGEMDGLVLDPAEIIGAYKVVANFIVKKCPAMRIEPVSSYLDQVSRLTLEGLPAATHQKPPTILFVDVDGSVFPAARPYDANFLLGNINDNLEEILEHSHLNYFRDHVQPALDANCGGCDFRGYCSGAPVAEMTDFERVAKSSTDCRVVKPFLKFLSAEVDRKNIPGREFLS